MEFICPGEEYARNRDDADEDQVAASQPAFAPRVLQGKRKEGGCAAQCPHGLHVEPEIPALNGCGFKQKPTGARPQDRGYQHEEQGQCPRSRTPLPGKDSDDERSDG